MADIVTESILELRHDNPMYNGFLFDKAKLFLKDLYADSRLAPKGSHQNREFLLYACGQGFLTGYGAAIDGEYDKEMTEVVASVATHDWWTEMLRLFGDREFRPFTLPRASLFMQTADGLDAPEPALYYMGYGFVSGFERGLDQMATGEVDYLADDSQERREATDLIRRLARASAYDAVVGDLMRVDAILCDWQDDDLIDDEEDDDWDDLIDDEDWDDEEETGDGDWGDGEDEGYLDEHWDEMCDELEETGGLIRQVEQATRSYVEAICERRSGYYAVPDEIVANRTRTYASHYEHGYCVQALGDIDDGDAEDILSDADGDLFARDYGTDYDIERSAKFGRMREEDVPLAKAYVRNLFWQFCDEEGIDGDMLDPDVTAEEWAREEMPIPHWTDGFWCIAGVAFASGARQASEDGRSISPEGKLDYMRMQLEMEGDYGFDDFDGLDDEGIPIEPTTIPLPDGYEDMSLTERFLATAKQEGDDEYGRMVALSLMNAELRALHAIGKIDKEQVIELDETVRRLREDDGEFREAIVANWEHDGNVFLFRLADELRTGGQG